MPTFMDRHPELRECIKQSELTKGMLVGWQKNTWKMYHEAIEKVLKNQIRLEICANTYGLHDLELAFFQYLIVAFTVSKHMIGSPRFMEHVQKEGLDSGGVCANSTALWLSTMEPFANQATLDLIDIITGALRHSLLPQPIPANVRQNKAVYGCATFLRDFSTLRAFENPLTESTSLAWKRTTHHIEPLPLVQQFMSGEILREADAHTYEGILLARLSLLQHVTHPETIRLLLADGGPKHLYQHLLAQLYPHQPAQIAHVKSWAAKWQGGVLLAP